MSGQVIMYAAVALSPDFGGLDMQTLFSTKKYKNLALPLLFSLTVCYQKSQFFSCQILKKCK